MHGNHIGRGCNVDDGGEVCNGVVGILGVDGWIGCRRRNSCHTQRIAVRRGTHCFLGTHHAAAAGLVFHHHRLANGLAQRFSNHSGNDVGGATWGKRHLQFDDFAGVILSSGGACHNTQGQHNG